MFIEMYDLRDVRGSMHHSIIHKENPTRCNVISVCYFIIMWSSTCFGGHTAHHQEPKTTLAASGFAYVEGCWTCSCWTLTASRDRSPVTGDFFRGIREFHVPWGRLTL